MTVHVPVVYEFPSRAGSNWCGSCEFRRRIPRCYIRKNAANVVHTLPLKLWPPSQKLFWMTSTIITQSYATAKLNETHACEMWTWCFDLFGTRKRQRVISVLIFAVQISECANLSKIRPVGNGSDFYLVPHFCVQRAFFWNNLRKKSPGTNVCHIRFSSASLSSQANHEKAFWASLQNKHIELIAHSQTFLSPPTNKYTKNWINSLYLLPIGGGVAKMYSTTVNTMFPPCYLC